MSGTPALATTSLGRRRLNINSFLENCTDFGFTPLSDEEILTNQMVWGALAVIPFFVEEGHQMTGYTSSVFCYTSSLRGRVFVS